MLDFWLRSASFAVGVHQCVPPCVSWSVCLSSDASLSPDIFCMAVLGTVLTGMSGIMFFVPAYLGLCLGRKLCSGWKRAAFLPVGGSHPARLRCAAAQSQRGLLQTMY